MPPFWKRFRLSEVSSSLISCFWPHIGKKGIKALLATKAYQYLPDFQETAEEWQSFVADYVEDFRFTSSEQAWAATLLALKHDNPRSFLKNGRRLLISKDSSVLD